MLRTDTKGVTNTTKKCTPYLVLSVVKLSSELEFLKGVVCLSICCGFGFVGFLKYEIDLNKVKILSIFIVVGSAGPCHCQKHGPCMCSAGTHKKGYRDTGTR